MRLLAPVDSAEDVGALIPRLITKAGWYTALGNVSSGTTTALSSSTTAIMAPFPVRRGRGLDRLNIQVTTAATTAGATCRFVLCGSDVEGVPDAVLSDFGTVPIDSTGTKEITVDWTAPVTGLYWLMLVQLNGVSCVVRSVATTDQYSFPVSLAGGPIGSTQQNAYGYPLPALGLAPSSPLVQADLVTTSLAIPRVVGRIK